MQPELEDTEAAVRRLLPDKTEIDKNELMESESVEFYRGKVLYNTAYNWRHFRSNMVSIGITTCTIVYIGFLHNALRKR